LVHTEGFVRRPRVDLGDVHAWTSARSMCMDHLNMFHKCPFSAKSTRGHLRSPRVDFSFQQGKRTEYTVADSRLGPVLGLRSEMALRQPKAQVMPSITLRDWLGCCREGMAAQLAR
jgi:hypothetical protein